MKMTILVSFFASCLCGCGALGHYVTFEGLDPAPSDYVTDATQPDSYPNFMVAEGNIYSCRYGIHHQSKDDFEPPKAQLFASLLAKHVPAVERHKVVLQRFDVYYNYRLKGLNRASSAGGIMGQMAGDVFEPHDGDDAGGAGLLPRRAWPAVRRVSGWAVRSR